MNKEIQLTRTPSTIADEINSIKTQAGAVLASAFSFARRSVFEIGKRLEEAKSLLPHGEWGKWLAENVAYSESTAGNIMRCYREFGDEQIDMLSGVSDAEFFGTLSQSQMVELFALPKAERREFVEAHREELESGEMSVRDMKVEITKLRRDNEQKSKALEKATGHIKALEKDANDLNALLDEERRKPDPEPIVQEVIVNQPSEAQLEAIRAETAEQLRAEFNEEREAIEAEHAEKIKALEEARDEAVKDAAHAEDLETKLEKTEAAHKAEVDKLNAAHEKKIAELEASYKKQAKAQTAGADPSVVRVQIALEGFRREVRAVTTVLQGLTDNGEDTKADKLRAQVEAAVGKILAEAGWTV